MTADRIRVKPLEWYDSGYGTHFFTKTAFGLYEASGRAWSLSQGYEDVNMPARSLRAAMAAAEADYDRRVLAMIEPGAGSAEAERPAPDGSGADERR